MLINGGLFYTRRGRATVTMGVLDTQTCKIVKKEFRKVIGYKNQYYFYILAMNNPKNEIKKTIPPITASIRIKYLGMNLTIEVCDLYTEKQNMSKNLKKI